MLRSILNKRNEVNKLNESRAREIAQFHAAIHDLAAESVSLYWLTPDYAPVLALLTVEYVGIKVDWKHVRTILNANGLKLTESAANALNWTLIETIKYQNNQNGF